MFFFKKKYTTYFFYCYRVRQQQLAQIHELMKKQSDKFGNISLSDVEEQMKLYQ